MKYSVDFAWKRQEGNSTIALHVRPLTVKKKEKLYIGSALSHGLLAEPQTWIFIPFEPL